MVALYGDGWVLAPCLRQLVAEADKLAPNRSIASDGSIGDRAHQARQSDHNIDYEVGTDYVDALDLTHDPAHNFDAWKRANEIKSRRDPRVDYIVSFDPAKGYDVIWSGGDDGWDYHGGSDHASHMHVSVLDNWRHMTSITWFPATEPTRRKRVVFLPCRHPDSKAGVNPKAGRVAGYTISGTRILGLHGASLAGDFARDGTDIVEGAPRTEVRWFQTKAAEPLADLFYWVTEDNKIDYTKIGAYTADRFHGTLGPFRCT